MKYNKYDLERMILVEKKTYSSIGETYGVSGNAIKKAAKRLGIELPKRRKVGKKETFNRGKCFKNKVEQISDDDFKAYVKESHNWDEITKKFGYKNKRISKNVRDYIYERCTMLGMVLDFRNVKLISERTKGELFGGFKNWQSARSFIRKDSQATYIKSGKPLKCKVCGYDKHVEIAHIKAVSEFPPQATIGEINSIDNLIALCPNHHWEYDNGVLKI